MSKSWSLSRRTLLRGAGAALALPWLNAMAPMARAAASKPPVRLAYLYFPNGAPPDSWAPQKVGADGSLRQLNAWMKPLESYKQHLLIPTNLWTPRGNGHGAGTATWLTGGDYNGRRIDAGGVSADQLAARSIGTRTAVSALQMSMRGEGNFSKDLSRNNISWASPTVPAERESEPRAIFDTLFFNSKDTIADRGLIDRVLEHAKEIHGRVGIEDQRKIDEYLHAVRDVEKRLETFDARAKNTAKPSEAFRRPEAGYPDDHGEAMCLMMDLMVLGFWSDSTRVVTFMLDHGQSNRYFNFIDGVKGTWHALSHWKDTSGKTEDDDGMTSWNSREGKKKMYAEVTRWHHEQFAYLLKRLDAMREGGRSLLDQSLLLYGSSLADGHEHAPKNLPLIVAGRGGGAVKPGRLLKHDRATSMNRLHLSMLQVAGVPIKRFAEADRGLSGLV